MANSIFHLQDRGETGEEGGFLNDVGATVVGGVLVSIGIAPTDEGTMLASDLDYIHLTAIVLLSLLLSYGIVFASGFDVGNGPGPFQRPVTEPFSCLVSLIVSGTVLYLLDAIDSGTPPQLALAMIVVLTLPATIGGAAGRLVIDRRFPGHHGAPASHAPQK